MRTQSESFLALVVGMPMSAKVVKAVGGFVAMEGAFDGAEEGGAGVVIEDGAAGVGVRPGFGLVVELVEADASESRCCWGLGDGSEGRGLGLVEPTPAGMAGTGGTGSWVDHLPPGFLPAALLSATVI